jgi:hypothetical protein
VSIEIEAGVRVAVTLADVLAHAQGLLSSVPHDPIGLGMQASEICIGPFEVAARGPRRYRELLTTWKHGYLPVSLGPVATVTLVVGYRAFPSEIDPEVWGPAEAEPGTDDDERGYFAGINAGYHRTRASFCLAALLASSIADRSRSHILDEENLFKLGRIIDPGPVAAMFARYRDAGSFEELSDAFCDAIDFAPNWPRAREVLAELQRSSH